MRAPVNLSRLRFDPASGMLAYQPKAAHDVDAAELSDPLEFLARVLIHLPEPNKHLVRFYGAYANRVRSALTDADANQTEPATAPARRTLNKRWSELIHRIYDVDPLVCTQCGDTMKVLAFVTKPDVIFP